MMKLVFTPDWFLGKDVLIELFSFIVLAVFFFLCMKYYKLNKKKNIFYLGIGFLFIAVAQLATILTKLVLYYDTSFTQNIGHMVVTYNVVKSVDFFYELGFFFNKLLTLAGLYIIYRIPMKKNHTTDLLLGAYFIIISAIASLTAYFFFHFTALILLVYIIENYYSIYKENKNKNTKILLIAFSILGLSQLFYVLSNLSIVFVIANILELVSYIMLLIVIIKILAHGKKKK